MQHPPSGRPNVIWIFGDQHRAQTLGCMGDPNVSTPNIDRLAAEGVVFTAAVAGTPLCSPYRGSLLTGYYPHRCVPGHEHCMPPDQPTIATRLRAAGYRTGYFGKWHVDGFHEGAQRAAMHIVPPERRGGFDDWVGYENNNSQWDCWVHGGTGDAAFHERLPGYETDALTHLSQVTVLSSLSRSLEPCSRWYDPGHDNEEDDFGQEKAEFGAPYPSHPARPLQAAHRRPLCPAGRGPLE